MSCPDIQFVKILHKKQESDSALSIKTGMFSNLKKSR